MTGNRLVDDWNDGSDEIEETIEDLDDEIEEDQEKPFNADLIRVETKPISVKQMVDMIDEEQLDLDPDFQRRKVWTDNVRKSLLIESLMLRIPLPVFYVHEDSNAVWHVVDGLQRMSTIYEFYKNGFNLRGLKYLNTTHKGKKFNEIEQKYKNRIKTTALQINVIDSATPAEVKYEIFRRINTGGMPLVAQEIRNSTATTMLRKFFKQMVNSSYFIKATDSISDMRMQAQELVLRFCAFHDVYDFSNNNVVYNKKMTPFLDESFDRLNRLEAKEFLRYEELFDKAMRNAFLLFGKNAFRKRQKDRRMPINKSLFTAVSIVLSYYEPERVEAMDLGISVKDRLDKEMLDNKEFAESLSRGTGDSSRVKVQFETVRKVFREVLGDA